MSLEDDIAAKVKELSARVSPARALIPWLVKRHAKDGWRWCDCRYCMTKRAASNDISRMLSAAEIDVPIYYHRIYDRSDIYRYIREEIRKNWHQRLKVLEETFLRPEIEREMQCLTSRNEFKKWISNGASLKLFETTPECLPTTAPKLLERVKFLDVCDKHGIKSIAQS